MIRKPHYRRKSNEISQNCNSTKFLLYYKRRQEKCKHKNGTENSFNDKISDDEQSQKHNEFIQTKKEKKLHSHTTHTCMHTQP